MDLAATQIYEDEDFLPTQRASNTFGADLIQVGTLSINSTEYQIKNGITKIGRLSTCDIIIKDVTVSKIHAEIEASAGQGSTWICDLNSSNKTKLNNLILRSNRLYELKNGSTLEFGKVRATYTCTMDDTVIPETPAPSRQKVTATIIPNTPDSSLNNTSSVGDDESVIFGTQRDKANSIFRQPLLPQRQSTSTCKQNSSCASSVSGNDNSQIVTVSHTSSINVDENQKVNMFEAETQNFEESHKPACSIHDMETQGFPKAAHVEANTNLTEASLNSRDEIVGSTVATNIHDMETQNNIGENYNDTQKSKIDQTKSSQENLDEIQQNIRNLETQKHENERTMNDIYDAETQLELNCDTNADKSSKIQLESNSIADNQADKNESKDNVAKAGPASEKNTENVRNMSKSRSSSPRSLNLSSPGIDEDGPSPLNESTHLLETTDLLEYFSEGIDKFEEIRASNASTPNPCKTMSPKRDNNTENTSNMSDKEDDIFDAATQQRSSCTFEALSSNKINEQDVVTKCKAPKKIREKQPKQNDPDDSETDAEEYLEELFKEQRESASTSRKLYDESTSDRKNPGTSTESEDMFDVPTQRSSLIDNAPDTICPIKRSTKINKTDIIVSDTVPTQIIEEIDKHDQDERSDALSSDINDTSTHLVLPHRISPKSATTSKNLSLNNNRNDDTITTANNNTRSDSRVSEDDCENADYELAPTQVIGNVENENSNHEKPNLDDTLERDLNQMFENVNNDSIHEPEHMSTQYLENILESSQCDNDLSTNESVSLSVVNVEALTKNTTQIQPTKKSRTTNNQSLRDQPVIGTNTDDVNNVEIDSQNSDIYFSTLSTKRKRNILKDRQELEDLVSKMISSHQDANSSEQSKINDGKIDNDNIITKSSRRKKIAKNKDAIMNDDDVSKTVSNDKRNLKKSRTTRQTITTAPETDKQVLERNFDKVKVDDAEKDSVSDPNIYAFCPPKNKQTAQTSNTLYETDDDDDILTRLPAIRISGTLSNPSSPSGSSISKSSYKSKRDATTNKKNKKNLTNKSLNERNIQNTEGEKNSNQINDNKSDSLLDGLKSINDISDDSSDSETNFKRFKQMSDRINNEYYTKRQNKGNARNTAKKSTVDKKKNTHSSSIVSEDPKRNVESRSSLRVTRSKQQSNKQNDEEHSHVSQKEVDTKSTIDKSSRSKSIIADRKRSLIEEDIEQNISKKHKANLSTKAVEDTISTRSRRNKQRIANDRQLRSLNMLELSTETNSRENSPVIENTRFSTDDKIAFKTLEKTQNTVHPKIHENIYSSRSKEAKYKSNDRSLDKNSDTTKQAIIKLDKINQLQNKTLKIVLHPITGCESQEVEMIMAKSSNNVQNENLIIRERNNVNIFQRQSRTRSRKQPNTEVAENSISIESNVSSTDSSSTQFDDSAPKAKRGRFAKKNSVPSLSDTKVPKKKRVLKKSVLDSPMENSSTSQNSQNSTGSNISSNSRSSRSKTASIKKEKLAIRQDSTFDDNVSFGTSANTDNSSLVSTPSTRRSRSMLSNSTPTTPRHKILFTGITEDYNKTIKALGGSKVDDPAKCTILVTDKIRRTYKFLCALAKGIPIVSINWLTDSESAAQFLDWKNYVLKDPAAETKFGFRLRKSLDKAKEKRLLDGYTVILTSGVAPPPIEELKDMVTSCGGKALLRPPIKWPERAVIISREEDLVNARKFLAKAPKTVTVQSTEFILTGILRQEVNFDKYKLT